MLFLKIYVATLGLLYLLSFLFWLPQRKGDYAFVGWLVACLVVALPSTVGFYFLIGVLKELG